MRTDARALRVYLAYWRQWVWFYVWKWTYPVPWLHRLTIRPIATSRQDYLEIHRRLWPKR